MALQLQRCTATLQLQYTLYCKTRPWERLSVHLEARGLRRDRKPRVGDGLCGPDEPGFLLARVGEGLAGGSGDPSVVPVCDDAVGARVEVTLEVGLSWAAPCQYIYIYITRYSIMYTVHIIMT